MREFKLFSGIWIWILLLSCLNAQEGIPTLNISQICPDIVMTHELANIPRVQMAVLPLADNRAVVFPCQLKLEHPPTGNGMNYFPDQSIMIHYINVTTDADDLSTDTFRSCTSFITFKPATHLDTRSCNLPESNFRHIQFVFWSNEEDSLKLHLNNYNANSDVANYLQIYMTRLKSDNSHACRVQQYDLTQDSSTSCQSNDYKLRRYCAEFDCILFREGRFQSLLNTTHTTVKWLKVSDEEIVRVIVATICPLLIVCLLILFICVVAACCRVSDPSSLNYEEETTKTSLEGHKTQ